MDELVEYLRANRDTYTRETLTRRLQDEGHDAAAIEAAWGRLAEADAPAPGVSDRRGQAAALLVVAYVGTWLVFAFGYQDPEVYRYGGQLAPFVLGLLLLVPGLIGLATVMRNRRLEKATRRAILPAIAVPLAFLIGLSGLCIATYPPYRQPYNPPAEEET